MKKARLFTSTLLMMVLITSFAYAEEVMSGYSSQGMIIEAEPDFASMSAPKYPRIARKKGWEGEVLVKAFVDKYGKPLKVRVKESSGHDVLDKAAIDAVRKWKFVPAKMGSSNYDSETEIPVQFVLKR